MASNDIVGIIAEVMPPATLFAAFGTRPGGSTPAEQVPVYAFDAAVIEYLDFYGTLHGYAGGGLSVTWPWMSAGATTGVARWGAAFRRIADDAEDVDTAQTYDFNEVDDTTANVSGETSQVTIPFTNGVDMDSLANNENFILRIERVATHANDSLVGDAQMLHSMLKIVET